MVNLTVLKASMWHTYVKKLAGRAGLDAEDTPHSFHRAIRNRGHFDAFD
jgi:hypothetical protein